MPAEVQMHNITRIYSQVKNYTGTVWRSFYFVDDKGNVIFEATAFAKDDIAQNVQLIEADPPC